MEIKKPKKLGALIDLSQIEDGLALKRIVEEFDKLDNKIRYQIKILFEKKFNDLADKYNNIENALEGNLENLENIYETELKRLHGRIDEHHEYSEATYMKKTDLIGTENLSEDLREKIYWLLANAGENSGYMTDYNGELRKVKWSMYVVLFADKILYLKDVVNKTANSSNTISWEDWYGENYENDDFSSNCVELWMYDRPAESYLPLFYMPVTDDYDPNKQYYFVNNGVYILWNGKENYNPVTWNVDKKALYIFDEAAYENELINTIENNNYSKTYVLRNLGELGEYPKENDTNRIEPICGKVSFNADAGRFTFDNPTLSRYIFKLVKYEY